jgi:hypothetical protein
MRRPTILQGEPFDWAAGAEAARNIVGDDGEVNWMAAASADPGVVKCPGCGEHLWREGERVRCPVCGHEFDIPQPPKPKPLAEQLARRCKHFSLRGVADERCGADVSYRSVRDTSQRPYAWPCIGRRATTVCALRVLPTSEEAQQLADALEQELAEL